MLAGVVVSAIVGGMAGAMLAISADHGFLQTLLSYQLGGMIATLGFVFLSFPAVLRSS